MKGRTLILIGIIAAIVGAAIIYFRTMGSAKVVTAGGILFVAVGILNMILLIVSPRQAKAAARILSVIANTGAAVLGVSMLVFTSTFTPLITFVFGLLVGICSLWQFFLLAVGVRPVQLPGWLYSFPMILAAAAVYIILQRGEMAGTTIMLVTGSALALFGLACVTEGSILGARHRKDLLDATPDPITTDDLDDTTEPPKQDPKTNEIGVNEKKSTK